MWPCENGGQRYLEQKEALRIRKEDLIRQEKDDRKRLSAIVSRDGFLCGAEKVLSAPIQLGEDAVKRGELPAKIKPAFVDDLLAIGTCVCGSTIDDAAREKLLAWRGMEGLAAFEESINLLRNAAQRLRSRRERFATDLAAARAQWALTNQEIRKATEQMSAIDSELQGKDFGLEYVRGLQNRLKEVCDDIIAQGAKVTRAQDYRTACEQKLEKLREDRKRRTKDEKEANTIQKRFDATRSVAEALQNIRKEWLLIVQEYLDGRLKQNWESVAQLDRLVEFTASFQLGIKERGPDENWTTSAPSSANLRALALCFVSALIKLAADIGADGREKGEPPKREQLFQGGDYPLVMDAPFATMDRYFKQAVPTGLRQVVPQMAIISNYDQWSGDVENVLRPALGSAYVLELHTPGGNEDNNFIQFGGRSVDYVVGEPNAVTDWSVIREVSL
jgi:DNA sulfur modification protein DndD